MAIDTGFSLPPDLPVPVDDGACRHLLGLRMRSISAPCRQRAPSFTSIPGPAFRVSHCPPGGTRSPARVGARRKAARFAIITPNSQRWALTFYSLSTQSTEYQKEMAERLHLPFPALSDANFALCAALRLPMFEADGKRLTLIIADGRIEAVFYPIFPPDRNAGDVIDWLRNNRVRCA